MRETSRNVWCLWIKYWKFVSLTHPSLKIPFKCTEMPVPFALLSHARSVAWITPTLQKGGDDSDNFLRSSLKVAQKSHFKCLSLCLIGLVFMQQEGIKNGVSRTGKYLYYVESSELYAVEKKFKTIPQGEGEGWVTDTKDLLATLLYQLLLKGDFPGYRNPMMFKNLLY